MIYRMRTPRSLYYDLFSKLYDSVIRLHSRDRAGSLRTFIAQKANLSPGDRALDLCTGTGSVALELARCVGNQGLVIGLDFSRGMLKKAKEKAARLYLHQLCLIQADASQLPFKCSSFHGVTCSHAFYELKGPERMNSVRQVARVLKEGGRFCLMEHARPEKLFLRLLFHVRIFFLGSKDAKRFLAQGESIFNEEFINTSTAMSPTGQSKLIYAEKRAKELTLRK
jgi:ubiquinone/menaquinone biosynthesis C-methylase UbiE